MGEYVSIDCTPISNTGGQIDEIQTRYGYSTIARLWLNAIPNPCITREEIGYLVLPIAAVRR